MEIGNETTRELDPDWDLGLGRWGRYALLGGAGLVSATRWRVVRGRMSRRVQAPRAPPEARPP